MPPDQKFDIILFGGSGFTGKYVIEELAITAKNENIKWAVAGRSAHKLREALQQASAYTGENLDGIEIIVADVENLDSIMEMCFLTKLLLNCVGPYRLYGNVVVQTCIEVGCHYVDVCGETEWLEKVYKHCNEQAQQNKLYILQACGFDSIPADMGATFTKANFPGELDYIESYVEFIWGNKGFTLNDGTWKSLIHSLSSSTSLGKLRRSIYTEPLPQPTLKPPKRKALHYSDVVKANCSVFAGSDKGIVDRSNYTRYVADKKYRPFTYKPYFVMRSYITLMRFVIMRLFLSIFLKFSAGIKLLIKFPEFFSAGIFSSKGPTRQSLKEMSFEMTFVGRGLQKDGGPEEHQVVTQIRAPDPSYLSTSSLMVQAAYVVLKEAKDIPQYGVLTPGRAFEHTSLIQRLSQRNITFNVVQAYE